MSLATLLDESTRRKLSPADLVTAVRAEAGVELVSGFGRIIGGQGLVAYDTYLPTASVMQLRDAYLLRQQPGAVLRWETEAVPEELPTGGVAFILPVAMGLGSPFPQPTGQFELWLDGHRLLCFCVDKRSRRWTGEGAGLVFDAQWVRTAEPGASFSLDPHVRNESSFADGLSVLLVQRDAVRPGRPARLEMRVVTELASARWVRVARAHEPFGSEQVLPSLALALSMPVRESIAGRDILFGDLHNHSGETQLEGLRGCGRGSRASLFEHARDVAGLDFFCLSEHDWQMSRADWQQLDELTEVYDDPGRFVTVPGFEWTSPSYGHRNVYFRDSAGPLFRSGPVGVVNQMQDDDPTPLDLWHSLDGCGHVALTIPHHMSAAQFPLSLDRYHHSEYDRVAEIYSCWGDSLEHTDMLTTYAHRIEELAFINAVRQGYQVGFVASSDSHDGHPGNAQGTDTHKHLYHYLGSGLTGVLADGFDRAAVFDAIRARRCYACTGGLVLVSTSLDGHPMGSVVPATQLPAIPALRVQAESNSPIQELVVYKNGVPTDRLRPSDRLVDVTWTDEAHTVSGSSYFVKLVRADHEVAWTTPVWVA